MQTKVVSVRYDADQGLYHGRVDLERNGRTFRYPCRIEAPASAPRHLVERALARQALRMSESDQPTVAAYGWPAARTPVRMSEPGPIQWIAEAWSRLMHPLNLRDAVRVRADAPRRPRPPLH
jgi:hypothetical protein